WESSMANRDILAIGTSAGGVEALRLLAGSFPADLRASVLVVIHLPAQHRSMLDVMLSRAGPLPAAFSKDGEPLEPAHIYLAPAERHLLVEDHRMVLGSGPPENNSRPAIDPMFRSIALCCGPRAIGVVLSGTLGDGASGLQALKRCGGIAVVQDPKDAAHAEMARAGVNLVQTDHCVVVS